MRTPIANVLVILGASALVALCAAPAVAVTPPKMDTRALIVSAPVGPSQPTRQETLCTSATSTRPTYTEPSAAQTMMNLGQAWRFSRGRGQRVAVIDTGVTPHPRLDHLVAGGDYVAAHGSGLDDCDAHGTMVAGIIAARPDARDGFSGVAPEATIIAIRQSSGAFAPTDTRSRRVDRSDPAIGSGYGSLRTLAHAIVRAVDVLHATVINISLVACSPTADNLDDPALGAAIKHAYERDVVVVVAAGNVERSGACRPQNPAPTGSDLSGRQSVVTIPSPAWYSPYVLAVGAVDSDTGAPSSFSLHGPWVSVAAPGTDIVSLDNARGSSRLVSAQRGADGPSPLLGTSFATPYVTGTVALVRSRFPGLSARQVMDRIIRTAHAPGTGHDPAIGHGVIDPVAALTAQLSDTPPDPNAVRQIAGPAVDPAPDHRARNVAIAGVGVCAAVIAAALAVAFPHRRVRRLDPDEF